ncbi:hypothetical protein GWK91_05765 [Virgibacillus sp. MSP4-1]|uniref:hypothetical protein n=1 Tax=Virgibacillus sp. MSP4-1 TaxID=2700081 RepID=UPI00039C3A7E|nr:hypothetical protein [Virgibacillus sp. MSP4-1]QHS22488.1 hypothetical protein GWK91_05765 [Virgibacillus sp. MSP4-1]
MKENRLNNYHCCATCVHFLAGREDGKVVTKCKRLGYYTKSNYQFNCWDPKPRIRKILEKKK